jgi:hypothetical protein
MLSIRARIEHRRYTAVQNLLRLASREGGVQPTLRQQRAALYLVERGTCEWQHAPGIGPILRVAVPPLMTEQHETLAAAMLADAERIKAEDAAVAEMRRWLDSTPTAHPAHEEN